MSGARELLREARGYISTWDYDDERCDSCHSRSLEHAPDCILTRIDAELAKTECVRLRCCWPRGMFTMLDEPDEHGSTYLILPDGQMVSISHHADPLVNPAQVRWMMETLNNALRPADDGAGKVAG